MNKYKLKTCPFCGGDDLGVKDVILERKAGGKDEPASAIRTAWVYCRRCRTEGPRTTGDFVYDSEIEAAATVAWNRRNSHE